MSYGTQKIQPQSDCIHHSQQWQTNDDLTTFDDLTTAEFEIQEYLSEIQFWIYPLSFWGKFHIQFYDKGVSVLKNKN